MKLIQCVPNFSEGRRPEVIGAIRGAMESAGPTRVVDCSWDYDHNRSVITVLGEPDGVRIAMLAGATVAVKLIDLREHRGEHPRIGALDVVPLVPVRECTMDECVAVSHQIGRDFAEKLGLPVFFYEHSAASERRTNLADIRRGGFEALLGADLLGDRTPDAGPTKVHPTAGAVVVGARGPLIAYNVNLRTGDVAIARDIAAEVRKTRDEGTGLAGVKAIGINLRSRGIVQVSTNITRPECVSVLEVFRFIEGAARSRGVEVAESELVGVLREDAVLSSFSEAIHLPPLPRSRVLDTWITDAEDR